MVYVYVIKILRALISVKKGTFQISAAFEVSCVFALLFFYSFPPVIPKRQSTANYNIYSYHNTFFRFFQAFIELYY